MLPLETLLPTETLEIDNGLALVPRVKLTLTVYPSLLSYSRPIDEWQLKRSLIEFLKSSLSISITVSEEDFMIRKIKDLKKRKREDPVAYGALLIRDLGFLGLRDGESDVKSSEKKFLDWRNYLVEKMDGIELNLEGLKYTLNVAVPVSDDFEKMRSDWEEFYALGNRGYSRGGGKQEPDTIIVRGMPSRWFAEPRVSSKPSMLVTHTIFSTFGKIRTLNVAEDNDLEKNADEANDDLVSGLYCKIVIQFEKHKDFFNTLKVLCGRTLQKQGSRLKADYEVTWDKDGVFKNTKTSTQDKPSRVEAVEGTHHRRDLHRYEPDHLSQLNSDDNRRKRFKE